MREPTLVRTPFFALCGAYQSRGNSLPGYGAADSPSWDPDPAKPGGFRGLRNGFGDPHAAFLQDAEWAVVRVPGDGEAIDIQAADGTVVATKFRSGDVFFRGERRGALEALRSLAGTTGSIDLACPDSDGVVVAGAFGVAVAGSSGIAHAGPWGTAMAESYGVAIAGAHGTATIKNFAHVAIAGAGGRAIAGEEGLAFARGDGGFASAGTYGIAFSAEAAFKLTTADHGYAVATGPVDRFSAGKRCVVVAAEAVPWLTSVTAGAGTLVIFRFAEGGAGQPRFAVGMVGQDGFEPDERYVWADGAFRPHDPEKAEQVVRPPSDAGDTDGDGPFTCQRSGYGGEATVGNGGVARAGAEGYAAAGMRGVAIAGEQGKAWADTEGVAISLGKRYGSARAGDRGVAFGQDRFKIVSAGDRGLAIGFGGSRMTAGRNGVALGSGELCAGTDGLCIALAGSARGEAGCLLVACHSDESLRRHVAWGVVGPDGFDAGVDYGFHEGRLIPKADIPHPFADLSSSAAP